MISFGEVLKYLGLELNVWTVATAVAIVFAFIGYLIKGDDWFERTSKKLFNFIAKFKPMIGKLFKKGKK